MKILKRVSLVVLWIYLGGCIAQSWTYVFGFYEPFCWPYTTLDLWYGIIMGFPT